jgi:hypothetical protein
MIERRARPRRRRMTKSAVGREARRRMSRIRCTRVIGFVASVAVRGHGRVVPAYVTGCATHRRMSARQREDRLRVIKRRTCPVRRAMA